MIGLEKILVDIVDKIVNNPNSVKNKNINVDMYSNFKDDLDFDDLDEIEFIMELEKVLNINIPDDLADEMYYNAKNLKDILPILKEKYNIFDIRAERKEKIEKIENK